MIQIRLFKTEECKKCASWEATKNIHNILWKTKTNPKKAFASRKFLRKLEGDIFLATPTAWGEFFIQYTVF